MKTIIVPLDFSSESLNGLNFALILAGKTGADVQLIHVIGKGGYTDDELLEKKKEQATLKFEEILKSHQKPKSRNHTLSYTVIDGKIFEEITDLAEAYEDALIVLSAHGQSGFEELFIGGNAYKITSHSRTPVITIRRSTVPPGISKIVLPLDITFQTREKVPYTAKLAKIFNAEVHIVSVRNSNIKDVERKLSQYTEQVAVYMSSQNIRYTVEHLQGDNLTDITIDYAQSVNADLISIMTEQEKSISNLLLGSYAHQMINKSAIPVLSFPTHHITLIPEDFRTEGMYYA